MRALAALRPLANKRLIQVSLCCAGACCPRFSASSLGARSCGRACVEIGDWRLWPCRYFGTDVRGESRSA
eukprot:985176-Prymnesium_polylepis.2